jgi:hypothetical protein
MVSKRAGIAQSVDCWGMIPGRGKGYFSLRHSMQNKIWASPSLLSNGYWRLLPSWLKVPPCLVEVENGKFLLLSHGQNIAILPYCGVYIHIYMYILHNIYIYIYAYRMCLDW